MHQSWVSLCLTVLSAALILPACHSSAPVIDPGGGPAADPLATGLPGLSGLSQPERSVSLKGPGFMTLDQHAILASAHMTPGTDPLIGLDAASGLAYAVYGVYGFDGDNGPTSARLTATAASGQCYVGFSDYTKGKWLFTGFYAIPAGGGVVEAEIPNSGDYVSPNSFVGPNYHATYLAVLVPEGGSLTGLQVELGVHGGMLGPAPCLAVSGRGGDSGMQVRWRPSPDYLAPDFAGYLLERAPAFTGSFTSLTPSPVAGDSFSDSGAELGGVYRYRVAAVDASGNMSTWTTGSGSRFSGTLLAPVPVVELPHGPLFGPVTLNIDMGDSYDPEGGAIDTYEIEDTEGDTLYSGAAYVLNLTLQPGCHTLRFTVRVGARSGTSLRMLKVYPQWRDHAVLAGSPATQVALATLLAPTAMYVADASTAYLSGYDLYSGSYIVQVYPPAPSRGTVYRLPMYQGPMFSGEPVEMIGEFFIPLSFAKGISLAHITPSGLSWLFGIGSAFVDQTNDRAALATDGISKLWAVYGWDDGVYRLRIAATHAGTVGTLLDPAPALIALDSVYNPSANAVEVVYSAAGTTEWMRVDADTLATVDNAQIAPLASPSVDIEYNPAAGEPCVAYCSGAIVRYREHSGAGWSAEDQPDPSGNHSVYMDLEVVTNGARIAISEIGGQASIYRPVGPGVWDKRDINHATATGNYLNMAPCGDVSEDYFVTDTGTDRGVYFARENTDGSEDMFCDRPPTVGQGYQMHGAGGSDDLHAVWLNALGAESHVIGSADGESWASSAALGDLSQLDLTALKDGSVYLSQVDSAGVATLSYWNGAAFVAGPSLNSATGYRAFFAQGRPSTMFSWGAYDTAFVTWVAYQGNESAPYSNATALCQEGPPYDGVGLIEDPSGGAGVSTDYLAIHGGAAYADSEVGLYAGITDPPTFIYQPSATLGYLFGGLVRGRTLAAAQYVPYSGGVHDAYYMSNGVAQAALRYTPNRYLTDQYVELPTNAVDPYADMRRTVSAITTESSTAVALVCDLGGHEPYMEWSGLDGEWEQLPLPGPDSAFASEGRMSQAELFTGLDGRWHILYRDWATDVIYCRSTL